MVYINLGAFALGATGLRSIGPKPGVRRKKSDIF
jgi:hypothetical protein